MCVRVGADINRLAWRRAGKGPAHGADSVRSSLPILMRHCEGLGSGLQQGPPLGVTCSPIGNGGSQEEVRELRWLKCVTPHTRMADGKSTSRNRGNDMKRFKVTYRKLHQLQELFPVNPSGPWCQTFVCRNVLLWTMRMSRWHYASCRIILDKHGVLRKHSSYYSRWNF